MKALILSGQSLTMSSLEIAEMVGSRHDKVTQSIERLSKKNIIQLPPVGEVEAKQSSSPNNKTKVYFFNGEQGKRDSIIVVAQLSPDFTAKLVDRWQELESQARETKPVLPDFNDPVAAARAWADEKEQNIKLTEQAKLDAPKVEYADAMFGSQDAKDMNEVAKTLAVKGFCRNKIFALLREKKILMSGARKNEPYQAYVERGWFKVEQVPYNRGDTRCISTKTVVLPKGADGIRKLIAAQLEVSA